MSSWEDLRKQARKLENELDAKLIHFTKLGVNSCSSTYKNEDDREPLLSSDHLLDTVAEEIEQLLSKLTVINDKMAEINNNDAVVGGPAMVHTLQRHRDILQDYKQEFNKTLANVKARKERENLLHSVRKDIDAYKTSSGLNRRMDLYMKENEHIRSSDRLISEQINIAIDTREHLTSQRHHFKRLQTRIHDLSSRFPLINNLVQKIHIRKRRDSMILAFVIVSCTFLLLLYAMH